MLTDLQIKKLETPPQRREIPDGKISGLFLVIQPTGAKSWAVRYRAGGQPKKFTIGPYPSIDLAAARRKAQEALGEVAGGNDPSAAKVAAREARRAEQATADRVETVAKSFVERYARRSMGASWARETERALAKDVLPQIGFKRIGDVKRSDVNDVLDRIVDRGAGIQANRTLAVLRRMFNWCIERGLIDASPAEKIRPPALEQSRDRVLTDDEVRLAWGAFDRVGWPFGSIAKLLLLTGARRDEVGSATWGEIDLAGKTWTLAKERSKNGVAHEVPLSDAAVAILARLPRIGERKDALVFSTTGKTAVSGFSKAKEQIDTAMLGALKAAGKVEAPARWTFHDLRRTAASGMAGLGIAPHVVEAVLNHKSGTIKGVAAVYNRYSYAAEKREALDAWARRLDAIVNPAPASNVVEIRRAAL